MKNIKLETYRNRLMLYYKAEEKVLEGQAYTIGTRSLTRANLKEIQNMIQELESKVHALETRGTTKRKIARIIPKDF